jgi:hypothetical protein
LFLWLELETEDIKLKNILNKINNKESHHPNLNQ